MEEFLLNIRSELIKNNYNSINEIDLQKEGKKYTVFTFINDKNQRGDYLRKKLVLEIDNILNPQKINNFINEYTRLNKKEKITIFEFKNNGNNYLFRIERIDYKNGDFCFKIRGDFSLKTISY